MKEPKIDLFLGEHNMDHDDDHNMSSFEGTRLRVKELLDTTTGDIYIFLENGESKKEIVETIENLIADGVMPSLAFSGAGSVMKGEITIENLKMFPTLFSSNDKLKEALDKFTSKLGALNRAVIDILDEYFFLGEKRVKLKIESTVESTLFNLDAEYFNTFSTAIDLFDEGKWKEALQIYKELHIRFAEINNTRERMIARTVTEIKQNNEDSVVLRMGRIHSGIAHKLNELGYKTAIRYIDKPPGKDFFGPPTVFLRRIMNFGIEAISELDCYKSLISSMIDLAKHNSENTRIALMDKQEGFIKNYSYVKKIKTLEDVEKLRKEFLNKGEFIFEKIFL